MLCRLLIVFVTVLMLALSPATAQDSIGIDYQEWEQIAAKTEALTGNNETTVEELTSARTQIGEWRGRLQEAQNVNAGRIKAIREQIDALGPVPAEGATEDEEIAKRRESLQQQLSTLTAPRIQAVEAFSRADAIVTQIDDEVAGRQAVRLAQLSPSPFNPKNWAQAASDGMALVAGIANEVSARVSEGTFWARLQPVWPTVAAYLVVALLLLTVGRQWIGSLPTRLSERASDYSRAVVAFAVSLGQIALPTAGLYLLVHAVRAGEFAGEWTLPFWDALPISGAIFFAGSWLARSLFPRRAIAYNSVLMDDASRNAAGFMVYILSGLFALHHLFSKAVLPLSGLYERIGDEANRVPIEFSAGSVSVWHYVLLFSAALALFRLGSRLRKLDRREFTRHASNRYRILSFLGKFTRLLVVLIVCFGALGFINLANSFLWPWISTLALIGLLILLKDFIADLYSMAKQGAEGARDGLAPMLTGFVLIVLALPLFLAIWGARRTELFELWVRFKQGVSFGGINLSPGTILTLLIVFTIGYMVTRGLQSMFRNTILPKTRMDPGGQNAVVAGLGYVGVMLAALAAITSAGIDLSSLAIVAGALSVGIGFGLQNIVSNFVSGIILLIERPISVGDWIQAGGQQGIVKRISVRSTQVETFDKTEVIVPNSDLISQPVVNWTRNNQTGRIIIPVTVVFGTDSRKVAQILQEIIEDQPLVTVDPEPVVMLVGIGPDGLNFEIRAILSDVGSGVGITSEVYHRILERFAAEDIRIPFAQREIWLRNPEDLLPAADAGQQPDQPDQPPRLNVPTDRRLAMGDIEDSNGLPDDSDGGNESAR